MGRKPVPEAKLTRTDAGLQPEGDGWYVLNVSDMPTGGRNESGYWHDFEGDGEFPHFGINIQVLQPGQPNCKYHAEEAQEDFLVLSGECIFIVEGEERRLRQWDFAHAPPWTDHVFVGAGDGPCAILMVGARLPGDPVFYPVSDVAAKYGASAERDTPDPAEAYAAWTRRPLERKPWPPAA
jgi:uncharacterized cupin superfamily protein